MTDEGYPLYVFPGDNEFLNLFKRRLGSPNEDTFLEDYLFEAIEEDFKHSAQCLWDPKWQNLENCSQCDHRENCPDAITEAL